MRPSVNKARYPLFEAPSSAKLSVVRTQNMCADQIRQIGIDHVGPPLKGHATVDAAAFLQLSLHFDPDGNPYAQHANIVGWSSDPAARRAAAIALAEHSTLVQY